MLKIEAVSFRKDMN